MKSLLLGLICFLPVSLVAEELQERGMFKENYALPFSYEAHHPTDRKAQEIKFQFSLYQRIFTVADQPFYVAYTQSSWWQAYDQDQSRPFRETNYNPELFLSLSPIDLWGKPRLQLGAEHQSNGGREPYSRSWNRVYGRFQIEAGSFQIQHKIFWRVPEQPKKYPLDPRGDENPDIVDYYGANELELSTSAGVLDLFGRFRRNLSTSRGAVELMGSYPFGFNSASFVVQYFQGYGENLADYDRQVTKLSVGILLNKL